ncbi:MAG TPA: FecR domain-containing protein [Chitinophagaceae bacterium]|nr:FecR domain-containing protein [Chitinophagaceae bacterium]
MASMNIKELLDKYVMETITAEETRELFRQLDSQEQLPVINEYVDAYFNSSEADEISNPELRNRILDRLRLAIESSLPQATRPVSRFSTGRNSRVIRFRRFAAAASIILVLGLVTWLIIVKNEGTKPINAIVKTDIPAPQNTRATITLADGRVITLDSVNAGTLTQQSNITVTKTTDGKIVYSGSGDLSREAVYNTLNNPRGSKVVDVTLTDGSHVWLNAGSSITYPVAFIGNERKVSITGEAYFEVSHDASKPFFVSKGELQVQVLGTHFNVNAYDDESEIKVTLLEGSVKVSNDADTKMIKPGEQAAAVSHSPFTIHHSPDLGQVMAWKNGMFEFSKTDLKTIMRQVSRWYDVEIVYESTPKTDLFGGGLSKNLPLSEVLQLLEGNGVKFIIEGRKLYVR